MHAGACSNVPKYARPPASACEIRMRLTPPWKTARAVRHGSLDQAVERRQDAVERLTERLAAEEALVLLADRQRADEHLLELVRRHGVEPSAAPLCELGDAVRLDARRDDRGRLGGSRQRARDDEVQLDAGERAVRRGCLLVPALGEQHDLGIGLADVGDLGVPHQIQAPAHAA